MLPAFILRQKKRHKAYYIRDINLRAKIWRSLILIIIILLLHTLLIYLFEEISLENAIWLTLTTATTVGYGDFSATTTAGRLTTVVLLYFVGIFVLANFAGEYFEGRIERKKRMLNGNWDWNMNNHIIIINTPESGGTYYFFRLISQFRKNSQFKDTPIQILTRQYPKGLPKDLLDLGVVHHTGYPDNHQCLRSVNISQAYAVIILAKYDHDVVSDALSFDILHRIKEFNIYNENPIIIAECVDDNNRQRFLNAGANIVIRPVRVYPEILVRSLVSRGTEKILENLFIHEGDQTVRYDIKVQNFSWNEIVCRLINAGYGTALAYFDENNEPVSNAPPDAVVNTTAIMVLARNDYVATQKEVESLLT